MSSSDQLVSYLQDNYPSLSPEDSETIVDYYPVEPPVPNHGEWFPSASRAYGESTFICPTINILNAFHRYTSGANIWSYRYNVHDADQDAIGKGVAHVTEAPAIFGPDMLHFLPPESYFTYNSDIVPLVMNYIISFVRVLNPNPYRIEEAPKWQPWGATHSRMLFQTHNSTMEDVGEPQRERCDFWKSISGSTHQK